MKKFDWKSSMEWRFWYSEFSHETILGGAAVVAAALGEGLGGHASGVTTSLNTSYNVTRWRLARHRTAVWTSLAEGWKEANRRLANEGVGGAKFSSLNFSEFFHKFVPITPDAPPWAVGLSYHGILNCPDSPIRNKAKNVLSLATSISPGMAGIKIQKFWNMRDECRKNILKSKVAEWNVYFIYY